jgi:ribosomal-protein-alanine N-acetyltransferase
MTEPERFDFTEFPVLTTQRIVLRQAHASDAADVLVFRGDPAVQRYNGPVFENEDEARDLIREIEDEYDGETGVGWAVTLKEEGRVIGLFGYHNWDRFHRRSEIGYDLARAYWGRGIASEAMRAILTFGFQHMDLNRVEAHTIADNHESVRMLERLGFEREGTRRRYSWEDDGAFHDGTIYGLLRDEWTAANQPPSPVTPEP